MDPMQFAAEVRSRLSLVMLGHTGAVLYSSTDTVARGRFYLIGLNPGGDSGPTVESSLDALPEHGWNAYYDDTDWTLTGVRHPLQNHVVLLMDQELEVKLRRVCASNLVFKRSAGQHGIIYPKDAEDCWPVHEWLLSIIEPSVIIAFGNGAVSPYDFLKRKFWKREDAWHKEEGSYPAEHGNWRCKAFETEVSIGNRHWPVTVLGLPHLSRYTVSGKPRVVKWIRDRLR